MKLCPLTASPETRGTTEPVAASLREFLASARPTPALRRCLLTLAAVASALAQSTTTTYTPDLLNGGSIALTTSNSSDHTQSQIAQSLNGVAVPLEKHEERVISRSADGTVTTESIVRKYDPTGQLASTERTVTEQRAIPGGGSTVNSTTYRTNIDGGEQPVERRSVDTHVSGSTTAVNTIVERPGVEGGFQTTEKRSAVTEGTDAQKTTAESVYRPDPNGGLAEAERKVIAETHSGARTVVTTTLYQPGGAVGALQFQERRVATTTAASDGSKTSIVDVYAPAADGHVEDASSPPQLKQEQITTHEKRPDGSYADVFSIRETNVNDAAHLGPARVITQTVCTGNCDTAPVRAPVPDAAAKP